MTKEQVYLHGSTDFIGREGKRNLLLILKNRIVARLVRHFIKYINAQIKAQSMEFDLSQVSHFTGHLQMRIPHCRALGRLMSFLLYLW